MLKEVLIFAAFLVASGLSGLVAILIYNVIRSVRDHLR